MPEPQSFIESAFKKLSQRSGFTDRPDQRQLAMLLSDCIEGGKSAAFEAPTGLGKSLAALIPAIAHAITTGKRTVIATYTNVLAEQYWRSDLPLALSLFDQPQIRPQFLIGRQRYACMAAMNEIPKDRTAEFRAAAKLGIETEFRQNSRKFGRELAQLWQRIAAPPVCPGRLCTEYQPCYYYSARRGADRAPIVITNHSVVLTDAIAKRASTRGGLLGDYDFLVVDEAHDFSQAALNSLEFELSESKLSQLGAVAQRIQTTLQPLGMEAGDPMAWNMLCEEFRKAVALSQRTLGQLGPTLGHGILRATPTEVWQHPQIQARATTVNVDVAREVAIQIGELIHEFMQDIQELLKTWRRSGQISGVQAGDATDTIENYCTFLMEFARGCTDLFTSARDEGEGVGVTYASSDREQSTFLRHDVIGLAEPLRELIWSQTPAACLSATLATDGNFDFFRLMTGFKGDFEEILPSPFDHATCCALYLPGRGLVSDPALARKGGTEEAYYDELAVQISQIIRAVEGRTLVLFHSRKEMEGVHSRMAMGDGYPIYVQRAGNAGSVGERFIAETRSSLFGVRSFWTGFDAPGETLSCVVLVRVPFEVPIDPAQVTRMAWMQTQGLDAFASYSLPLAKTMMRQGAGRLIRRSTDKGIVAILDPRLRTKRYGEEILANLPDGMSVYEDVRDAVGAVGLDFGESPVPPAVVASGAEREEANLFSD